MHTIDFTQILLAIITLAGSILAPVLTVVLVRMLRLNQDTESRRIVATAVQNGIAYVESQADDYAKKHGKLAVSDENVARVADYVMPKVQDSLNRLNVHGTGQGSKGDQLGEVIAAQIAQRLAPPTVVSAPAPSVVTVKQAEGV